MFDNLRPVSLDKDSLNEQMQAHRVLVSDIQDHKARVRSVAQKCRGAPGAQEMVRVSKFLFAWTGDHSNKPKKPHLFHCYLEMHTKY